MFANRRIGLLILAGITAAGCQPPPAAGPAAPATPAAGSPAAAVEVIAVKPKQQTLNWSVDQPGSIAAFEWAPLAAKLPGYVAAVNVDLGDTVKKDQVLARLSVPELVREREQKAAMIKQSEAEVALAVQLVEVAKVHAIAAKALVSEANSALARTQADYDRWQSELKRIEGLVDQKVLDTQSRDETQKQFRSATASREESQARVVSAAAASEEAKAQIGRYEADVLTANAKLAVARSEEQRVAALLTYTEIKAPFDGTITARFVHPGHFLSGGSSRPEPLLTIARLDVVRVAVEVPENVAGQINPGTKATVRIPALKNREFAVAVTRTSRTLNPESRTMRIEIDVTNSDGTIRPGMYAQVRLACTTPEAFTLPAAAVLFADETAYVYEVVNGKAVKLRVQIGRTDDGTIEVLGKKRHLSTDDWKPIGASDTFVSGNLGAIIDGQAVTVKKN